MYAILLLSVVSLASAAPWYSSYGSGRQQALTGRDHLNSYFSSDDLFDTKRFWQELSDELLKLDDALEDFYKHFPTSATEEKVDGNQYVITTPLSGYSDKDIVVKARDGLLMIQATRRFGDNNVRSDMNLRSLPANVNVSGTWTYDEGILKIVFPLKETVETTTEVVTEAAKEVDKSREEMENTNDDIKGDVDVGLTRGDKNTEIFTNEIPNNEAVENTTYAVDISDEVEFVPITRHK